MRKPSSVMSLTDFGRTRLSDTFFMRDFLYSEIAAIHGMANVPDNPDVAIAAGTRLCEDLLEPLQAAFGRIAVRSAFRSAEVNGFGAATQVAGGKKGYTCASNSANAAGHIWDLRDTDGCMGATACIVVPAVYDRLCERPNGWKALAWWIHDSLPYADMTFYPKYWAFNLSWHERPKRWIYSEIRPDQGYLTRAGYDTHDGSHAAAYRDLLR